MRPEVQYLLDKTLWGIESVKINSSSAEFGPVAPLKSREQSFVHPSPGTKGPVAAIALCKMQSSLDADDTYQGVPDRGGKLQKEGCLQAGSFLSFSDKMPVWVLYDPKENFVNPYHERNHR